MEDCLYQFYPGGKNWGGGKLQVGGGSQRGVGGIEGASGGSRLAMEVCDNSHRDPTQRRDPERIH